MRNLLTFSSVAILAWLMAGAPAQVVTVRPFERAPPSDVSRAKGQVPVPTWEESVAAHREAEQAVADGNYQETQEMSDMRSAVIDTFDTYKSDACDKDYKAAYIKALIPYLVYKKQWWDKEYPAIEKELDEPADNAYLESIQGGYVLRSDLPGKVKEFVPSALKKKPRCDLIQQGIDPDEANSPFNEE